MSPVDMPAHPGADFDVDDSPGALFVVEGGVVAEAGEMATLDIEIEGLVDENGVVRWRGER